MNARPEREILNAEEAAAFLGVSIKTFNRVLRHEGLPARKIGREWKFSRQALVDWVGSASSLDFYREAGERGASETEEARRTAGWRIHMD